MCYILTGVIPNNKTRESTQDLLDTFKRLNLSLSPVQNQSILKQTPNDMQYISLTNNHCDCGTAIGSKDENPKSREEIIEHLKKSGNFDNEKLMQITKIIGKDQDLIGTDKELALWEDFVKKLLLDMHFAYIGILKHSYSKTIEDEEIFIKDTIRVPYSDISKKFLKYIDEDKLYVFENNSPQSKEV